MRYFSILIIIFFTLNIQAQKSNMSINMGAVIPLGDFASTEGSFLNKGYANTGFYLSVEGIYVPTWYVGLSGTFGFGTLSPNETKAQENILIFIDNHDIDFSDIPDSATTKFSTGAWSYVNIFVGPALAYPLGNFQFDIKAQAGLSILMPPGYGISIKYDDTEVFSYSDSQNARFGYLVGADIIYGLDSKYSIKLGGSYFHSKTNITHNFDKIKDALEQNISSQKSEINVDALQLSLGLTYLF